MLVNDRREHPAHVKFVSYSGKWPTLCSGILVLEIDGKTASFGDRGPFAKKLPDGTAPEYGKFWHTGGECGMPPDEIMTAPWKTDVSELPEQFRRYAEEIDAAFNDNVEHGCCGGCR